MIVAASIVLAAVGAGAAPAPLPLALGAISGRAAIDVRRPVFVAAEVGAELALTAALTPLSIPRWP